MVPAGHRSISSLLTYQRDVSLIDLSLAQGWFRSVFRRPCMGNILSDDLDQVISWYKSPVRLLDEAAKDVGYILYKFVSFL